MAQGDRQTATADTDPVADVGHEVDAAPDNESHQRTASNRLQPFLLLLAGLAVGFVIALLVTGRGPFAPAGADDVAVDVADAADAPEIAPAAPDAEPADASSGRAAVEGFLAAEVAGDYAASFTYLSASDREDFATAASWESAHADLLPPITGFETDDVTSAGERVEVSGTLALEPGLDDVVGLVPATADATWVAVRGSRDAWGVDLEASTITPRYPPNEGAADAAAAWVAARQRCERSGEYDGGLLGVTGPVDALCNASGAVEVGEPRPLGELDAAPFQAAFGEDATTWARVVDVTAPTGLRVVLAPVGDDWIVIGVLPA